MQFAQKGHYQAQWNKKKILAGLFEGSTTIGCCGGYKKMLAFKTESDDRKLYLQPAWCTPSEYTQP